jgi:hypothetical protein
MMTRDYTTVQFRCNIADYTSVIELKLRYLKVVDFACRDRGVK